MPVHVVRAKKPGPTVFVSAAMHGDELNGIEIVRRLISTKPSKLLNGTLILVPMVNVYGVLNRSRYMPDRRDLNRCFPGSSRGSLAGAIHRSNLPQIRANLDDPKTLALAEAFGVPVLLNSKLRDGSLRQTAHELGTRTLLYEAGEALRFDELPIRAGVKGILNVLAKLGMVTPKSKTVLITPPITPYMANKSTWARANCSGIVNDLKKLGEQVQKGDELARVGSPFGELFDTVRASRSGIIIGKQNIPLVQEGDAMFHIAYFSEADKDIVENIELMQDVLFPEQIT